MEKIKMTKSMIEALSDDVIACGYCEIPYLLRCLEIEPCAYTTGQYGWNADIYVVDQQDNVRPFGVVICTGYRPFGRRIDSDAMMEAELAAMRLQSMWERNVISTNERWQIAEEIRKALFSKSLTDEDKRLAPVQILKWWDIDPFAA